MIVPRLLLVLLFVTSSAFATKPIKLQNGRVLLIVDVEPTYERIAPG